jgi:hypothetical protein
MHTRGDGDDDDSKRGLRSREGANDYVILGIYITSSAVIAKAIRNRGGEPDCRLAVVHRS